MLSKNKVVAMAKTFPRVLEAQGSLIGADISQRTANSRNRVRSDFSKRHRDLPSDETSASPKKHQNRNTTSCAHQPSQTSNHQPSPKNIPATTGSARLLYRASPFLAYSSCSTPAFRLDCWTSSKNTPQTNCCRIPSNHSRHFNS